MQLLRRKRLPTPFSLFEGKLCRILPHIFSGDASFAFLSLRVSVLGNFFEWLSLQGSELLH